MSYQRGTPAMQLASQEVRKGCGTKFEHGRSEYLYFGQSTRGALKEYLRLSNLAPIIHAPLAHRLNTSSPASLPPLAPLRAPPGGTTTSP